MSEGPRTTDREKAGPERPNARKLIEGRDYYREGGLIVFTAEFHLARGYCCGSGCRHCPFAPGIAGQDL